MAQEYSTFLDLMPIGKNCLVDIKIVSGSHYFHEEGFIGTILNGKRHNGKTMLVRTIGHNPKTLSFLLIDDIWKHNSLNVKLEVIAWMPIPRYTIQSPELKEYFSLVGDGKGKSIRALELRELVDKELPPNDSDLLRADSVNELFEL